MKRLHYFFLSILIIGSSGNETNEDEDTPSETTVEDTKETLSLTKPICLDGHKSSYLNSQCCRGYPFIDNDTRPCIAEQNWEESPSEKDIAQTLSKFAECYYKRKKYAKNHNNLHLGNIKKDAKKLKDPLASKYMVEMYRSCSRTAKAMIAGQKKSAEAHDLDIDQSMQNPFFLCVYNCVSLYSETHQCPHFRWGSSVNDANEECANYHLACQSVLEK